MAAGQTLVSIGVPVYNGETFLHQTLESLLAQDYENIEINISDNGSTDGTAAICQKFASLDPRIKFHQNAKNLGPAANFRRVFELAAGRYFMWAGAHDLWHPSFISSCMEVLENDPEVVLAYTRTLLIDNAGNPIELMPDTIDTRSLNAVKSYLKIIWELGYCNMFYGIFRVEILRKYNFHRRVIIGSDNVSLAWVSLQGSIAQVTRPLFYRRDSFPGETSEQAQNRRINMKKQAGLEYEAIIPYTLLAYAHLELIAESNLSGSEKDFLSKETIKCFFSKFSSKMDQESYSLLAALRNISMDVLLERERDRLFRLIKAVKTFFPDAKLPDSQNEARQVLDPDSAKPTPFISIVIPTYNRAGYIKDAIHSALAQNYEHLEILIVDDGSTDNTQAVVASFVSDKIRYIRKEHTNAPSTRNYGVREAKGDFILWLDSDDALLPDTVRSYVSLLQQFPDTDVCYGDLLVTDDTLHAKGKIQYEDWFGRNAELLARLFLGNCIPNPGTMVRRACFERVGMFDESFRRAHDYEWWSRLAPAANFRHAPLTVVKWRWHDSNMSSGSVNIDCSFDARIVHLMMERHSLPELFPQVDFSRLQPQVAEGLAYMHAAQRLMDLQDIAGAMRYMKLSHELHPDGQKLTLIQQLNALLPGPDKEQDNERVSTSPLLSVIVPTYNQPEMLVATLQSILDETDIPHEIIVVDDCGLEVESLVASLNKRQNIIYSRHGHIRGLAAARNTGINLARGEWLMWLDSGDRLLPGWLARLGIILEAGADSDVYYGNLEAVDAQGSRLDILRYEDFADNNALLLARLVHGNPLPLPGTLMRQSLLREVGYFDEELTPAQDYEFYTRLAPVARFRHVPFLAVQWRGHDGNKFSGAEKQELSCEVKVLQRLLCRHSLKDLFPDLPWEDWRQAQAQAARQLGEIFSRYGDIEASQAWLKESKELMQPECKLPEPLPQATPALSEARIPAAKKLKVLLVSHLMVEKPQAGTEAYVATLGKALSDLGMDVLFLAPKGPPCRGRKDTIPWRETRVNGLPLLQFAQENLSFSMNMRHPGYEAAFQDILQKHPVDLVHFHHTYLSSISLLEVSLNHGLPVVLTLHDAWHLCPRLHCINDQGFCGSPEDLERCATCLESWLEDPSPENRERLFHFLAMRRTYVQTLLSRCHLLAPSRFLRNLHYSCGVAPGRIIHLPLGLDDLGPAFQVPHQDPPRFVFLGNIIPVKRVDVAVEAFIPLADQAILEVWGGTIEPNQQQTFMERLAPYPHIRYRGPYQRLDLPQILAGAAALVMCSDFENYPLVAREALMLGVPVIATRTGGLPEIVQHGKNGLLFPPGDAAALRRQVTRLISRPALLERLRQGINPVKTLDTEAREMLDLYQSLTQPRTPRGQAETQEALAPRPGQVPASQVPASIIIPVFNNLELTQNCLESIFEHTPPGPYEIIVVDNGSNDGTPAFLTSLAAAAKIRHIHNDTNLGYAKACNQGSRLARGDYLVMLNNDTVVTAGWLKALMEPMEKDDNLAIVGAKLLYDNDSVQHAGVVFNQKKKVYHIYRYFHRDHPAVSKIREFQVVTGACLLIRTSVFLQMGLFDENFRNGFEDVDLCLRVRQSGYRIIYNPDCVVYHLESMTPGRGDDDVENGRYLRAKWQEHIIPDDFRYYEEDGLRMEWITNSEGGREAVIHDQNDNPYKQEARACLNQGDLAGAMALYNLALRFNPFDPRNRALIAEIETLKDMAEPRSQAMHA